MPCCTSARCRGAHKQCLGSGVPKLWYCCLGCEIDHAARQAAKKAAKEKKEAELRALLDKKQPSARLNANQAPANNGAAAVAGGGES